MTRITNDCAFCDRQACYRDSYHGIEACERHIDRIPLP